MLHQRIDVSVEEEVADEEEAACRGGKAADIAAGGWLDKPRLGGMTEMSDMGAGQRS